MMVVLLPFFCEVTRATFFLKKVPSKMLLLNCMCLSKMLLLKCMCFVTECTLHFNVPKSCIFCKFVSLLSKWNLEQLQQKNISNKVYLVTLAELFILGKVLPDMEPALWAGDLGFPPLEMDLARVCTELFCGGTRKPWLGGPASWLIL